MQLYITALQEGFLYGIVALGIFISLRILGIPDLTTEGSFGFGLAVSALLASNGHTALSIFVAVLAGVLAGCVTGLLQTKLKIHPVLAGIITMSALYSVNLLCLGSANRSLDGKTLFKSIGAFFPGVFGDTKKLINAAICALIAAIVLILVILFFKTHLGMCIRATGDNPDMVRASSINVDATKVIGLCLSNGLIALSGALIAHVNNYADINSSNGTLVVGLASVIIGEAIFGKRSVTVGFISAIVGSVIYRFIVAFVIDFNICGATMMKLVCALIVAVTLALPSIKEYMQRAKAIREAKVRN